MTVWATSVVIDFNGQTTNADSGTFTALTPHGRLPVPLQPPLGVYSVLTYGGSSGGTLAGQAGGIIVF